MSQSPDKKRDLGVNIPESFVQVIPELAPGFLGLIDKLSNPSEVAKAILTSKEMASLVRENKITVGMIKPGLGNHFDTKKADISFSTDADIEKYLVNDLLAGDESIVPLFSLTIQFDDDMLEEFYGYDPDTQSHMNSPMDRMKKIKDKSDPTRTQWDNFREMMLMGPSTLLIMGAKDGQARELWRRKIGPSWDVTKAQPGELRYLAISNYCNVWHGSATENAVQYELNFTSDHCR